MHPTDVVQQRPGHEQVGAQSGVQLGGLAAERCHADRVLEEPAGVAVVPVGPGRRSRPQALAHRPLAEHAPDERRKVRVGDLAGEELEEAFELVRVAAMLTRDPRARFSETTLTTAERDVLGLLRQGLTNREIARIRCRSVRTIANQVAALLQKTGAANRRALAVNIAPTSTR